MLKTNSLTELRAEISVSSLRSFLAVASYLSFQKAATQLGISQPTLTSRIKTIEKALGVQLFTRTTRKVSLTPEGERFRVRVRRLVYDFESAITEIQELPAIGPDVVRFSCIPTISSYIFPRFIHQFIRSYPGLNVEVSDDSTYVMEQRLLAGDIDFGIGAYPQSIEHVNFAVIAQDPMVVVCRKDHSFSRCSTVSFESVLQHPFVTLQRGSSVRRTLDVYCDKNHLSYTPAYEMEHHYSVGAMVAAGFGITVLPSMSVSMMLPFGLHSVPLNDKNCTRPIGIMTLPDCKLGELHHRLFTLISHAVKQMTL